MHRIASISASESVMNNISALHILEHLKIRNYEDNNGLHSITRFFRSDLISEHLKSEKPM